MLGSGCAKAVAGRQPFPPPWHTHAKHTRYTDRQTAQRKKEKRNNIPSLSWWIAQKKAEEIFPRVLSFYPAFGPFGLEQKNNNGEIDLCWSHGCCNCQRLWRWGMPTPIIEFSTTVDRSDFQEDSFIVGTQFWISFKSVRIRQTVSGRAEKK